MKKVILIIAFFYTQLALVQAQSQHYSQPSSAGNKGDGNTLIGSSAGAKVTNDGKWNTIVGRNSGYNLTTGDSNLYLGQSSGYSNQAGNNNIFIGTDAGFYEKGSNKLYIGVGRNLETIYGDLSGRKIGIKTRTLNQTFNVGGTGSFSDRLFLGGNNAGLWVEAGGTDWFMGRSSTNGNNDLRFYYGGDKMTLTDQGKLGLGTNAPNASFSFGKTINKYKVGLWDDATTNNWYGLGITGSTLRFQVGAGAKYSFFVGDNAEVCTISKVGDMLLAGRMTADNVTLNIGSFPDYVFADEYELMPLNEVESFINENKHLPNMPSEAEVVANGMDVKQINTILVEKVEELTLHTIAQEKKIDTQVSEITTLKEELEILKAQMQSLIENK